LEDVSAVHFVTFPFPFFVSQIDGLVRDMCTWAAKPRAMKDPGGTPMMRIRFAICDVLIRRTGAEFAFRIVAAFGTAIGCQALTFKQRQVQRGYTTSLPPPYILPPSHNSSSLSPHASPATTP
jgi:hypothetical protein